MTDGTTKDTDRASGARHDLLGVESVSEYLGVGPVTVYRWCREGRLPCLKVGKSRRIRRDALDEFLRRGERPVTLTGQLRSFVTVPDNLFGISPRISSFCTVWTPPFSVLGKRGEVFSSSSLPGSRGRTTSCVPSWRATGWRSDASKERAAFALSRI